MKENPLTLAWARWRLAYERSALAPYVRWWLDELAALMPPRVRAWFAPGMDAVARHEKSPSS